MGHRYQEMDVNTARPEALVVKLYEGAIRNLRFAQEHHASGRLAERAVAISKALAIVSELMNALDFEKGGEIAQNLRSLYEYVSGRLLDANLHGGVEGLEQAAVLLANVNEAWSEIARRAECASR